MKKRLLSLMRMSLGVLSIVAMALGTHTASAQCPFPNNPFGSGNAPTTIGGSVTLSTCVFAGEHSTLFAATAGHTYEIVSSGGSYFTVYLSTNTTAPVAFGNGPLTFTAPSSGDYFIAINTNSSCGTEFLCLTVTVTLVATQACVPPPNPGVATAPTAACPGNLPLTLSGASTGTGLVIQWQVSPDDVTFTDIPGAVGANVVVQHPSAAYYRAVSTCNNQSATSNSVFVDIESFLNCYCTSNATSQFDSKINRFIFNDIDVQSDPAVCATYTNNTSIVATVFEGQTVDIGVEAGTCGGAFTRYGKVWIDWNQNGVFDAIEEVFSFGPTTAGNPTQLFTGTVTIPTGIPTGLRRLRVVLVETFSPANVNPCGVYTWGETEDYMVFVAPPPANDAGISALVNPSFPTCSLSGPVVVNLINQGSDTLTSASFNIELNGFSLPSVPWTGIVMPGGNLDVELGTISLNEGDVLKIWTSNPNGVADEFNNNDTISTTLFLALQGNYTIGGTTPDFPTFAAATAATQQRGVCGDVVFNVRNGVYNEQVVLNPINYIGVGSVWFQSESGVTNDVTLTFTSTTTANNGVVLYRGADNVGFRSMTLMAGSSSFQRVVHIRNGSHNASFERLRIVGDTLVTFDDFNKILLFSDGDVDNNTKIMNCTFIGGSRAINLTSTSDAAILDVLEDGLQVIGNRFERNFLGSILLFNQANAIVRENEIIGNPFNFNNPFHISINNGKLGGEISSNYIYTNNYGFGITIQNTNGTASNPFVIANNVINFNNADNIGAQFPLRTIGTSSDVNIVNNSVKLSSTLNTNMAVRIGGTGVNFWNNNIVSEGDAYALVAVTNLAIGASDFNNLYSPVGRFSAVGTTDYADVAAWNAATGFDGASVSVDPAFADSLLTTCASELDNAAFPLPFVTEDFTGNARSTSTPDIGAYEFLASNELGLEELYSFCPENVSPIGVEPFTGVNYVWNPGAVSGSFITPSSAGTYTLSATSSCGTFSQSTEVEFLPLPQASFTFTTYFLTAVFTNTSTGGTSFLWNFGDGNTSTEENPTHLYGSTGIFDVTLTVFNECGSVTFSDKVSTATVGIEDINANSFNIYPNPSNGLFNINLDVNGISDLLIDVVDLSGRVVYSQFIANAVEASILTINIEGVKPGVYNVRLNSPDFNVVRKLIIK